MATSPTTGDAGRYAVIVLAFVQFVVIVDETTVSLLGPAVARDLGLGDSARQLLVTPFAAGFVCALPVAGILLRQLDPRRALIPATVVFAAAAAGGALADSTAVLVMTRAAQGAAGAVTATCVLAALHLLTRSDPRRRRHFAVFSLVSGSGAVAALILAAPLANTSWRWCFWAVAAAALLGTAAWAIVMSRARRPQHHGADDGPVGRGTPRHVRRVETIVNFAAVVGANAALAATVITASFALQQDHGWSPLATGFGFLPLNAAAAVGALVVARGAGLIGAGRLLTVGVVVLAAGCAAMAAAPSTPTALILVLLPAGLGVGLVFPLVNDGSLATAGMRPLRRAAALGAAQQTGLAAGALIAAADSASSLVALSIALVLSVAVSTIVVRRTRLRPPPPMRGRAQS